jgi:hypothetical protein
MIQSTINAEAPDRWGEGGRWEIGEGRVEEGDVDRP